MHRSMPCCSSSGGLVCKLPTISISCCRVSTEAAKADPCQAAGAVVRVQQHAAGQAQLPALQRAPHRLRVWPGRCHAGLWHAPCLAGERPSVLDQSPCSEHDPAAAAAAAAGKVAVLDAA